MSLSICTSCLARLHLASTTTGALPAISRISRASFQSSAAQQNVVKKKTVNVAGTRAPKLRESRSARINKKSRDRPRPPAVGERRLQRERIVLSNTNALEVQENEKLNVDNQSDDAKVGSVLALDGVLLDQLREAKAFKTTQNWNMFRTPSTLCRAETVRLGKDVQDVTASKSTVHKVITGERGSGKSIHLLQAMSMAYLNGWIVINVPEAQDYVTNTSSYAPVPKSAETAEQMYSQPQLTSDLLSRLARSNEVILKKLKLNYSHEQLSKTGKLNSVHDLAMMGAQDIQISAQVWDAVWKELTVPSQNTQPTPQTTSTKGQKESPKATETSRPPVLVAIDGINHWMNFTKYRSAEYKLIHAHQFALVKQFTDLLFSRKQNPLPNGGLILGATTMSNEPTTPTFETTLRQIAARRDGIKVTDKSFPMPQPYAKTDKQVFDLLDGTEHVQLTSLKGLSRAESKGLLEYFARSGIFREAVSDLNVNEKWSLSGGGIIGELCKFGRRLRTELLDTKSNEGSRIRC